MKTLNEWMNTLETANVDEEQTLNESLFAPEVSKKLEQINDLTKKIAGSCRNLAELVKFKKDIIAAKAVYDEVLEVLNNDRMASMAVEGVTWQTFRMTVWKIATATVVSRIGTSAIDDLLKATRWLVPALKK
jgi:hypothetical protein